MSIYKRARIHAATVFITMAFALTEGQALASDAGAFIGGVVAAKVMNNVQRRTEAEEAQAAAAQKTARAPAAKSPQQRMQELDKLAAGGYITPEEYKRKKQAILNDM